jgi:hypothetical protein
MNTLARTDLMSLEAYAEARQDFRAAVIAHKKDRQVRIGPNATLYFEDRLTVQYQIQEMLRIERIFESAAIEEELSAYNPLIPDGNNLKATFMLEYAEVEERRVALAHLTGVEDTVWAQVGGHERVFAIADEDMERSREEKTSAVHFVRFEFSRAMTAAAKSGAAIAMGIDHKACNLENNPLAEATRVALTADFS